MSSTVSILAPGILAAASRDQAPGPASMTTTLPPAITAAQALARVMSGMGEPVPQAVSVPLPSATTAELKPGVNVFPDAPDNFFTTTSIPECGVTLSFEEVDKQQV